MGVSVGGESVGVSDGTGVLVLVGGTMIMIDVGVLVGKVGMMKIVGTGVAVSVGTCTVGMGRLRLRMTRFSTSVFSPNKVSLKVTGPFGMLDRSQEYRDPFLTGVLLSIKTDHEPGSAP